MICVFTYIPINVTSQVTSKTGLLTTSVTMWRVFPFHEYDIRGISGGGVGGDSGSLQGEIDGWLTSLLMLWSIAGCHVAQTLPIICHFILTSFNIPQRLARTSDIDFRIGDFASKYTSHFCHFLTLCWILMVADVTCDAIVFPLFRWVTFTNASTYRCTSSKKLVPVHFSKQFFVHFNSQR